MNKLFICGFFFLAYTNFENLLLRWGSEVLGGHEINKIMFVAIEGIDPFWSWVAMMLSIIGVICIPTDRKI